MIPGKVLVSDFDGTMTRHDFYKLVIENLLPADTPDYWSEYRSGAITHFEALRRYFAEIRCQEAELLDLIQQMELDPALPTAVNELRKAGWSVIVTSAGCDWYIRRLLAGAGIELEVYSNPGRFVPGQGLLMDLPVDSPFFSSTLGVDKTAVVHQQLAQGRQTAFAGDGFPDAEPARLVSGEMRFARGDLAEVLRKDAQSFRTFGTWSDIAQSLITGGG